MLVTAKCVASDTREAVTAAPRAAAAATAEAAVVLPRYQVSSRPSCATRPRCHWARTTKPFWRNMHLSQRSNNCTNSNNRQTTTVVRQTEQWMQWPDPQQRQGCQRCQLRDQGLWPSWTVSFSIKLIKRSHQQLMARKKHWTVAKPCRLVLLQFLQLPKQSRFNSSKVELRQVSALKRDKYDYLGYFRYLKFSGRFIILRILLIF